VKTRARRSAPTFVEHEAAAQAPRRVLIAALRLRLAELVDLGASDKPENDKSESEAAQIRALLGWYALNAVERRDGATLAHVLGKAS
jgi:hypothetical protein